MTDEKIKMLEAAISQIEKQHGKGAIMRLGNRDVLVPVSVIPTGALSIDAALGVGGVPRGRVIEIYGPESGGKTTLTLHIIAEAQKMGGQAAFIDAEHALDPIYARKLGVDVDNLLVSQPDNGEQALEIAETLISLEWSGHHRGGLSGGAGAARRTRRRHGRSADGPAGAANVTGAAEADGHRFEIAHLPDFHQPDSRKNRCDVRQSGNHDRWPCLEILFLDPPRYSPHPVHQGRGPRHRLAHPREGGEK